MPENKTVEKANEQSKELANERQLVRVWTYFVLYAALMVGTWIAINTLLSDEAPTSRKVTRHVRNCMSTIMPNGWCNNPERIKDWMYERCSIPPPNQILFNEFTEKLTQPPITTRQIVDETVREACAQGKITAD